MKIYLDDLWPRGGIAQVPYLYSQSFNERLNQVMRSEIRQEANGRRYVEIKE